MVYAGKRKGASRMARPAKRSRAMVSTKLYRHPQCMSRRVKTTVYDNWTFSTASVAGYWRYLQWRVNDWFDWTSFAAVYDEYRVTNLKYTFQPKYNTYGWQDEAGSVTSVGVPYVHLIVDQASGTVPAGVYNVGTENAMLENGSAKTFPAAKAFSMSFRPKVYGTLQNGSTATTAEWAPWIRTSEPNILHNGMHAFIKQHNFTTGVVASYDIYVTATVEFRGSK